MLVDPTQIWLALIAMIPVAIASVTAAILALRARSEGIAMREIAEDTHTLVNSNMGVTLESYSVLATRMAKITKDPEDIAIAQKAEAKYLAHQQQQAIVDQRRRYERGADHAHPPQGPGTSGESQEVGGVDSPG